MELLKTIFGVTLLILISLGILGMILTPFIQDYQWKKFLKQSKKDEDNFKKSSFFNYENEDEDNNINIHIHIRHSSSN